MMENEKINYAEDEFIPAPQIDPIEYGNRYTGWVQEETDIGEEFDKELLIDDNVEEINDEDVDFIEEKGYDHYDMLIENYLIIKQGMVIYAIEKAMFREHKFLLRNLTLYDFYNGAMMEMDRSAVCIMEDKPDRSFISLFNQIERQGSISNILTGNNLSEVFLGYKPRVESTKDNLSFRDLQLLRFNPPEYRNRKNLKFYNESEAENFLLLLSILPNKGEVDEHFTIIDEEPSNGVIKEYLDILSGIISDELDKREEIEDLDLLKKKAYDQLKTGEDFEYIDKLSEKFSQYLRYKLIKDDKYCILKSKYDSILDLGTKLEKFLRRQDILGEGKVKKIWEVKKKFSSDSLNLQTEIDFLKSNPVKKIVDSFFIRRIDVNLEDFEKNIHKYGLNVEMAICYALIEEAYPKFEYRNNLVIIDKNNLICRFTIKKTTIDKWRKILNEQLKKAKQTIDEGRFELPYDFISENNI